MKNEKELKATEQELSDKEMEKVCAGQRTCGGHTSVGFPKADNLDSLSVSTTKSWFSTAYE